MGTRDPRIDAYIARSAEFARPILTYLREAAHEGCPEAKGEDTRRRRLAQAIEWMAEGKSRNWKYQ